jgi:hypothetical protein
VQHEESYNINLKDKDQSMIVNVRKEKMYINKNLAIRTLNKIMRYNHETYEQWPFYIML